VYIQCGDLKCDHVEVKSIYAGKRHGSLNCLNSFILSLICSKLKDYYLF